MPERSDQAEGDGMAADDPALRSQFDELFVSILPALYPRVVSQTRSRDDADEIINEVYLRLATGLAWRTLIAHPNPIGYSLTAAGNLIRDRWRRHAQGREVVRRLAVQTEFDTDGGFEEHDSRAFVDSVLVNLNSKEAAAVMLVDVAGHSLGEAGALLGVTKATVHENRQRGLARLRLRFPGRTYLVVA